MYATPDLGAQGELRAKYHSGDEEAARGLRTDLELWLHEGDVVRRGYKKH